LAFICLYRIPFGLPEQGGHRRQRGYRSSTASIGRNAETIAAPKSCRRLSVTS
jgi:hypothetical protein